MTETVDITPAAGPAKPLDDPSREIRIGLVLYGGVSLAIYIYGVVYEFWRLVRASRGEEENAYTPLLVEADAWATVDIISGASAGGINGVLLGKALATGADLAQVRSLWVTGGDFASLLRDPGEKDPPSLLRSERFDELLARGLAQMDRGSTDRELVDVFDLFAPGTRLRPRERRAVDDLRQTITMREYRKIFHLKFRKRGYNAADKTLGYNRNDFGAAMNPTLAQVARATSAFPVAFEPKLIAHEDGNEVLFEEDDPPSAWFTDGGVLHNKPFTEALATIFARSAERPVRRWLLSVEPDPEHFVPPPGPEVYPEATEVASKALMGIPRYESIARDLDDLDAHRQRVERVRRLLAQVNEIAAGVDSRVLEDDKRFAKYLSGQVLYSAYGALRREALAAYFSDRLYESVSGWRSGQREWIYAGALRFAEALPADELDRLDPALELRRIYRLLETLAAVRGPDDEDVPELRPFRRGLWAEFDRVAQVVWQEFDDPGNPRAAALRTLAGRVDADLREGVKQSLEAAKRYLGAGLDEVRARVAAVAKELDAALSAPEAPARPPSIGFETTFDRYALWDMFILPIDHLGGAGERDRVGFIRISPEAATYIRKDAAEKLAGDALGHFGGFARREWRENDILWGRLDAAEIIVRLLLEERERAGDDAAIRSVQEQIAAEELPNTQGDYRTFLEKRYTVGSETLAAISMADRATFALDAAAVARNMMRRLSKANLGRGLPRLFHWASSLLGFTLMLVRWPVLAVWGRDRFVRRALTVLILFIFGWAVVSSVLVLVFDVADVGGRFWALVGISVAIFIIWGLFWTVAVGTRRRFRRLLG